MNPYMITRRMRLSIGALAAMVAAATLAAIVVATTFLAASALGDVLLRWEGEEMSFSWYDQVSVVQNPEWSGGAALKYTGVSAVNYSTALSQAGNSVTIRAKAQIDPANPGAWPIVEVYKNSTRDPANKIATFTVNTTTFADYTASAAIPRDTTSIRVKAAGNMAGNQILWLDTVNLNYTPAATTPPETTITAAPSTTVPDRDATTDFDYVSSVQGATFQCALNGAAFSACPANGTFTGLPNRVNSLRVRAMNGSTPDPTPASHTWTNFICSGTDVSEGQNLLAIVEGAVQGATICVLEGTYDVSDPLTIKSGIKLRGQPGPTMTLNTAATGDVEVPLEGSVPVHIWDGDHSLTDATGNLLRVAEASGSNVLLEWLEVSGADSRHTASGAFQTGTGVGIRLAGTDPGFEARWLYVHHNAANGMGTNRGEIHHSAFHDNSLDSVSLGYSGSSIKSVEEFEVHHTFTHDEQGNGPWCDHECKNFATSPNGFWAHHNISVNNDRYGLRYEFSPRINPDTGTEMKVGEHIPQFSSTFDHDLHVGAVIENNYFAGNGYGGMAVQAAQNALIRNNRCGRVVLEELPDSIVGTGKLHEFREFGPNGSGPKCIQLTESAKPTDLWNADAYNNTRFGENALPEEISTPERIQGCAQANTMAYCRSNVPSTGDDADDPANQWTQN